MAVFGIKVPVEFRLSKPRAPYGPSVQTVSLRLHLHRCSSVNLVQRGSPRIAVGQIVHYPRSSFMSPQRKLLFLGGVCGAEVIKKFAI